MQPGWIFAVMVGGALGSLTRLLLSLAIQKQAVLSFPLATFLANAASCLLMGLFFRTSLANGAADTMRIFAVTGFCGGLSTFSAFSYETLMLARSGHWSWAFSNILLNVSFCLVILFMLLKKHP
jgi:CrcB protein